MVPAKRGASQCLQTRVGAPPRPTLSFVPTGGKQINSEALSLLWEVGPQASRLPLAGLHFPIWTCLSHFALKIRLLRDRRPPERFPSKVPSRLQGFARVVQRKTGTRGMASIREPLSSQEVGPRGIAKDPGTFHEATSSSQGPGRAAGSSWCSRSVQRLPSPSLQS